MRTVIIAEAGVNHNGSIEVAKDLIFAARESGADYIKFQTFKSATLASINAMQAEYQKNNLASETTQIEMLRKLELAASDYFELSKYSSEQGISFFSTAFDLESIDLLATLNIPLWKIPSGEITNLPYLRKIGSLKKHVVLSTGMSTLGEIEDAIGVLEMSGTEHDMITVLHCTTEYPAPIEEINLNAMVTIGNAFRVKFGYSDHTEGIEIPFAAVAMGATIIEKHLTLDRNMIGPDHKASLEPGDFKKMVDGIRKIESAMGSGVKKPTRSEIRNITVARKSIVAACNIKTGDYFTEYNICVKRPGNGLSPMLWDKIINTVAKRDYLQDELIEL